MSTAASDPEALPATALPEGRAPSEARTRRIGRTEAIALAGLDGTPVVVEASANAGIPGIDIVGLPDAAVSESRKRIRAALHNMGVTIQTLRYTVSLAPGSVRKVGTGFDLAIAVAILEVEGCLDPAAVRGAVFCGELGLDGRVLPFPGVLPTVVSGMRAGFRRFVVPAGCAEEAGMVPGAQIVPAVSLADCAVTLGAKDIRPAPAEAVRPHPVRHAPRPQIHDLSEVQGQDDARFALEVAAAGGHHLLMMGAPGAGKTLIASCLPGILPPLDPPAAVEVMALRSLAGTLTREDTASALPPFETPHHRTTAAAMLGSSRPNMVGVFSRAHRGVLFMDEAPEFSRDVLEALREPVESGWCRVSRAWGSVTLPAEFQLVMAANPCPCGAGLGPDSACRCTPADKRRYRDRLSGPLLDRVDIRLEMLPVTPADVHAPIPRESSEEVARRVVRAREAQAARYADMPWSTNARAPGAWLRRAFAFSAAETRVLDRALETGALSMRGYDRVVRIAASIADLAGTERPGADELGAALLMRTQEG
ncbi:YifB family Mg chelatase-like AAA ATPase [Brevibacterium album]|uniref:YifB family Mg chelatase-like AAA ATPase n=1 Tax=Brevibacterium album TaxID=417948 RepID=UPI00042927BF|nr:YifB family Mg chelatase-like AAA ATPase [Brevibacterium album]